MLQDHPMHAAFLADIREHPEDDTPRLIYSDWLEEQGEVERAEFIRFQVEMAKCPEGSPDWKLRLEHLVRTGQRTGEWHSGPFVAKASRSGLEATTAGVLYRRGFIHTVRCHTSLWLQHRVELVARHPLERVELTDKEPSIYLSAPAHRRWFVYAEQPNPGGEDADDLWHDLVGEEGRFEVGFKNTSEATAWLSSRLIAHALELAGLKGRSETKEGEARS